MCATITLATVLIIILICLSFVVAPAALATGYPDYAMACVITFLLGAFSLALMHDYGIIDLDSDQFCTEERI